MGNTPKRNSPPFTPSRPWQGPFAPRTLLRFDATMRPADSRPGPHGRLCIPLRRWALAHPVGSPRFPADLSPRAAPNHPGELDRCVCPLLPCRWQASPLSGGLAALNGVTRPNRVHVCCGSRLRLTRLRTPDYSDARSLGYLSNGQFTGQAPFSLQDLPGFAWRTGLHG